MKSSKFKAQSSREKPSSNLNEEFRNGGDLVEDREGGRDCISDMRLAHQRPDVLANALRSMGVTENGDEAEPET